MNILTSLLALFEPFWRRKSFSEETRHQLVVVHTDLHILSIQELELAAHIEDLKHARAKLEEREARLTSLLDLVDGPNGIKDLRIVAGTHHAPVQKSSKKPRKINA